MKKSLIIKIIITIFIVINIGMFYLLGDSDSRYKALRLVSEGQSLIFQKQMERYTSYRNYDYVAKILDKRLDYLKRLTGYNNTQTKSYFEEIRKSFTTTLTENEKKSFREVFLKISSKYPENFSIHLLLAQTFNKYETNEAFAEIDKAIKLIGASAEAYRLGINLAFKNQNYTKLQSYCSSYESNHFGGLRFTELNPLAIQEIGLRRIGLFINSYDKNYLLENNGVQIGNEVGYEFMFPNTIAVQDNYSLYFPIIPGVSIRVDKIKFYKSGVELKILTKENFILTAKESFFDDNGSLLFVNNVEPKMVEFMFKKEPEEMQVDKMIVFLSLNSQNLFSESLCEELNY